MKLIDDDRLIGDDGKPLYGLHSGPILTLNLEAFRFHGRDRISPAKNAVIRDFQLKRWQFMGVATPEFVFGAAIVHAGYLSNAFAYAFDRGDRELAEFSAVQPLAAKTVFSGNIRDGKALFRGGADRIEMNNEQDSISLSLSSRSGLKAELLFNSATPLLSVLTRVGLRRFNYTTKGAGLSVSGQLELNGKRFGLDGESPIGLLDYTYGYLARYTFWNWASGCGNCERGERVGFNFAQGVNETGYTENAFWINERLIKVDVVDFQYDDQNERSQWRIVSNDGKADLVFRPEGKRGADVNLGLMASRFRQPFGSFSGVLREGKKVYTLKSVAGFVEEHEAKW